MVAKIIEWYRDTSKDIIVTEPTVLVVSKLSNGTTTYTIKDANAYHAGDLATVATTGSYNDLTNKPTIPTVDQTYDSSSSNAQAGTAVAMAIADKVDKVSTTSKVYGTDGSGNQTTYSVASAATASTVAYRGTNGVLQVGTPTADAHATTKKYVDDGLATKQATLTAGTGITISSNTISTDRTSVSFVDWSA